MQRATASGLLRTRSWIGGQAWLVLGPVATAAAFIAILWWGRYLHENIRIAAILFIILFGTVGTFLGNRVRGWPAIEAHVATARRSWASMNGWRYVGQRTVDDAVIGLVLPRGWVVKHTIAAIEGSLEGRDARIETWALGSAPGSKRRPSRREVVELAASTGTARLVAIRGGSTIDPTLVQPKWVSPGEFGTAPVSFSGDAEAYERWGEEI
ncbi:MAG TPA: hypothetical protein H9830_05455 [Candidatus Agrococcus pullicola]|uniref:Uncharacterized protein n=1 Tax=Candidatus Agrococcus pullicola TaxID=2838429 RepID=A0A9D1YTZ6_9MICO|nr:hypothetical protein [Candidatus Agrococcus pullicola]